MVLNTMYNSTVTTYHPPTLQGTDFDPPNAIAQICKNKITKL